MRRNVADYGEFVAMRWPALVRTAYLLTGDHGHAEDLAQSALTKCLVAWPRLRAREAADAYVRKVMLNTYISWRRKSSWHELPSEDPPATESYDSTDGLAQRSVVLDALAVLPPKQRAVVVLRFYQDLGVRDVARHLGCSTGSVKRQTYEALKKLRQVMGDEVRIASGNGGVDEGKSR
jgi:RNA polymerase sigma-70 factor (sigma-E family)